MRFGGRLSRRGFLAAIGLGVVASAAVVERAGSPAAIRRGLSPIAPPLAKPAAVPPPAPTPSRASASMTIAAENRRAGDGGWNRPASGPQVVEAYIGRASVAPGERLELHAAAFQPHGAYVDVAWYRLGWYAGAGGRRIRVDRSVFVPPGAVRAPDPVTGLVEAGWPTVLAFEVDGSWPSGQYLAVVQPAGAGASYAVVVVRPTPGDQPAPVLFVNAAASWQAYNEWGGTSLYANAGPKPILATHGSRAAVVSFDRPYGFGRGQGFLQRWELAFIRWQERGGHEVDYAADVDLALHPEIAAGRRLIVFAGHHEYWSRTMRERLQAAVDGGTNVAFLSANEVYWSVRLDDGRLGPATRITCYKSAALDPLATSEPALATCRWREPPLNAPEAPLVGEMYGHIVAAPADWIVTNSRHWIYGGTGLRNGDRIVNLVGQEYDTLFPALAPPGTEVLARSPVLAVTRHPHDPGAHPSPAIHNATIYTASSGSTVVAAGTFQWSWALDAFGQHAYAGLRTPLDSRVARMTANLFERLGDGVAAP